MLRNRFVVCLDSSGSMQGLEDQVVKTFNSNVKAIRDGAEASRQESTIGLLVFGANGGNEIEEKVFNARLDIALRRSDYKPSGGTPLWESVLQAISKLEALGDAPDISNVVMTVTDGGDNNGQWGSYFAQLKEKIRLKVNTDRWSFIFLVPPGHAASIAAALGISRGNVLEWNNTVEGLKQAEAQVSAGIQNYYTARAAGQKSTQSFFTTNAAKLTTTAVKKVAKDISAQVRIKEVPREMEIKDFVEQEMGEHYMKGRAFYQLTKKEKVQQTKEIILIEKGKKAVLSGDGIRDLLGLPQFGEVKVEPGNHGKWDIYVQSTSTNRKLVRGTKVIYLR